MHRSPFGRRSSIISSIAFALVLVGHAGHAADAPPMMALSGQMQVGATGAFTYSIPIAVPPGTAGMSPVLTLDYSSQNGDGFEGLGWALSGIPAIGRCPKTVAQDGVHGGINYDSDDRFCMEGQRLVAISGTYGANNTEYRTEIDRFSKIVSYGTAGNGPSYFKVWTKEGQVIEFGNTTDSKILAVGTSTARVWAANRIQDLKGNAISVVYTNDQTNGQFYPTEIHYPASISPYNLVRFEYANRGDVTPKYQAGSLQKLTKVLTHIWTYIGTTTVVSDYRLAYDAGTSTRRSRLTSVTRCDGTSPTPKCLPPTTFGWQGSRDTLTVTSLTANVALHNRCPLIGDFNGDGLTDLFFYTVYSPNTSGTAYFGTSTFGTFSTGTTLTFTGPTANDAFNGYPGCANYKGGSGDINGDGISDLVANTDTTNNIRLGTSNGAFSTLTATGPFGRYFGDYNADGRLDSIKYASPLEFYLGNGDGSFSSLLFSGKPGPAFEQPSADYRGDGCHSVIWGGSPPSAFDPCQPNQAALPLPVAYFQYPGDFNGDGVSDVFSPISPCSPTNGSAYFGTGTQFTAAACGGPDFPVVVGDWNGDGKNDVAFISQHYGEPHLVYLSTGSGFATPLEIPNSVVGSEADPNAGIVADFNNDGASDLWIRTYTGETLYSFGYTPELLISVSNGLGAQINVAYDRLNKNGSFYTKDTTGSYPTQNVDGPLYAVSRIDSSNGLGSCDAQSQFANCFTTTYSYAGSKTDLSGRGSLGFSQVVITDAQTNVVTTTTYHTDFPYQGMVAEQVSVHSGVTLNHTTNTFSSTPTTINGSTRYFVFLTQSVVERHDLDGTAVPTTTTQYSSYDTYGNVQTMAVSLSDGSSKTTTNTFLNDSTNWVLGRLLTRQIQSVVGASNITRHFSYSYKTPGDPNYGLLAQEVVEPNVSTCNAGSSPCTLTTDYGYDTFGNRTSSQVSGSDISTRTSSTQYEASGTFVASTTNALSQTDAWQFDARFGLATSHTVAHHVGEDPANFTTTSAYDGFGRKTLETRPDSNKAAVTYEYCSGVYGGTATTCPTNGAFVMTVTPRDSSGAQNGPVSKVYFDSLSRQLATDFEGFDGSMIRAATTFDAKGRVYQTSRPYFLSTGTPKWTTNAYDDLARPTQQTFPDNSHTTFCYHGLTTSVTNNKNQTRTSTSNPQGLLGIVSDGTGSGAGCTPATTLTTIVYVYDAFGNLTTVTDPLGNVTTDTYDVRGRKIASADPDLGSWTYSYDVLNELKLQEDARHTTTAFTYDLLGRVTNRLETPTSGPVLTSVWAWDTATNGIGQLTSATGTAASYSRTNTYDQFGRPASTTLSIDGTNYAYSVVYDSDGHILRVNYPSGLTLKYLYTATQGYIRKIRDNATNVDYWTVNTRDAEMRGTKETAGNSVITRHTFDDDTGLLTRVRAGTNNAVTDFSFVFDTIGNLSSRTDSNQSYTENFCYDDLNRLVDWAFGTSCTTGTNHKTVGYNSIGNITAKPDACSAGACTFAYPSSGGGTGTRPHAVSSITGTVNGITNPSFSYDANGNMTAGMGRTATYTPFNMVDSITQSGSTFTFTYDPEHRRIKQVASPLTTVYLNALGAMSERLFGTTVNWQDYIIADGRIVAERFKAPAGGTTTNYFVHDSLGSIVAATDDSGALVQQLSYDAWGKRRNSNGTDAACGAITAPTTRGYTGHEEMDQACLVNMNARIYDPTIARFMSADSMVSNAANLQDWNAYSYVSNNPTSFTDPTGHDTGVEEVHVDAQRLLPLFDPAGISSVNPAYADISQWADIPSMGFTASPFPANFSSPGDVVPQARDDQSGLKPVNGSPTSNQRNMRRQNRRSSAGRNSSPCDQFCKAAWATGSVWSDGPLETDSGEILYPDNAVGWGAQESELQPITAMSSPMGVTTEGSDPFARPPSRIKLESEEDINSYQKRRHLQIQDAAGHNLTGERYRVVEHIDTLEGPHGKTSEHTPVVSHHGVALDTVGARDKPEPGSSARFVRIQTFSVWVGSKEYHLTTQFRHTTVVENGAVVRNETELITQ